MTDFDRYAVYQTTAAGDFAAELIETANKIATPGKGILAADESTGMSSGVCILSVFYVLYLVFLMCLYLLCINLVTLVYVRFVHFCLIFFV